MARRLRDRPVNEILVILISATVCFAVVASGAALFILALVHPESDTSAAAGALTSLIGSLISVLAGFVAGHASGQSTERNAQNQQEPPQPGFRPPDEPPQ